MFEPLIEVLRRVNGHIPAMGFLYGDLLDAKQEIALSFDSHETRYKSVLEIVDNRWNDNFKTPLHLASYNLNLYCYHLNTVDIERKGIFRNGLLSCMESMCDEKTKEKIVKELVLYQSNEGSFGTNMAKRQRANKKFDPEQWWLNHGTSAPNLRLLALRIMSLTCSSFSCERGWSTYEKEKWCPQRKMLCYFMKD